MIGLSVVEDAVADTVAEAGDIDVVDIVVATGEVKKDIPLVRSRPTWMESRLLRVRPGHPEEDIDVVAEVDEAEAEEPDVVSLRAVKIWEPTRLAQPVTRPRTVYKNCSMNV